MINIFGYIKPFYDEMKQKHIKEYKKLYCSLCYGLRTNFGLSSTMLLNYECVFLYIFLDSISQNESDKTISFRCHANPVKKVSADVNPKALEYASFINYYLALLKVKDNCNDSKNPFYKTCYSLLKNKRAYKKYEKKYSDLISYVNECYEKLYRLEISGNATFDDCSATMGNALQAIVREYITENKIENTVAEEFAKHTGMWIYLIDAYDDLEKDEKQGRFNPLKTFEVKQASPIAAYNKNGNLMLGLMCFKLSGLLRECKTEKNSEIMDNIINYGMKKAVWKIKCRKERNHKKCKKTV